MDGDFKIKDKLILELRDHSVIGELVKINENRTRLKLTNYYRFDNPGYVARGVQTFFKNDIKSIRVFQHSNFNCNELEEFVRPGSSSNCSDSSSTSINLTLSTLNHITELIKGLQIVSQIDVRYYNSVKILCESKKLAVSIEGITHGRISNISMITISNNANIFAYDILSYGSIIPKELSEILESNEIVKLVHDCQGMADNLKNRHNINLNRVFDTMIFHASIFNTCAKIGLFDCIEKYMNLPPNVLLNFKNLDWHQRPLSQEHKQALGNNVAYLFDLKRVLKQILLKPYNDSLDKYMVGIRDEKDFYGNITKVLSPRKDLESTEEITTTTVDFNHLNI